VLDGEQTGRVHRIRNLDVYTISPAIDEVKAVGHAASYRSAAVEIKATDAAPYRPVVRGPSVGWVAAPYGPTGAGCAGRPPMWPAAPPSQGADLRRLRGGRWARA